MTHICDQNQAESSHIGDLNQTMMTSPFAYAAPLPQPNKRYTLSFYAKGEVSDNFYDTRKYYGNGWFKYTKRIAGPAEVAFPDLPEPDIWGRQLEEIR